MLLSNGKDGKKISRKCLKLLLKNKFELLGPTSNSYFVELKIG